MAEMNGGMHCMTSAGLFVSLSEQMQEGISHRRMLLLLMDISGIHYSGWCWVVYLGGGGMEWRGVATEKWSSKASGRLLGAGRKTCGRGEEMIAGRRGEERRTRVGDQSVK